MMKRAIDLIRFMGHRNPSVEQLANDSIGQQPTFQGEHQAGIANPAEPSGDEAWNPSRLRFRQHRKIKSVSQP